jgi:hypothetical protein
MKQEYILKGYLQEFKKENSGGPIYDWGDYLPHLLDLQRKSIKSSRNKKINRIWLNEQ